MPLSYYKLSLEADRDIDEIFDYTEAEFGLEQAIYYITEFKTFFDRLIKNPALGRDRLDIKSGLRSFPKSSHIIFYRVKEDHIRIVRILHASRDIGKLEFQE